MKKSQISFFLKKQIKLCCYKEMDSIKPGNVHKYSEGHNMTTKDFYKSADIFALAYDTELEGIPIPIIEAMASGLPIVIPFSVNNSKGELGDAVTYSKNNPEAFSEKINDLLMNFQLRKTVAEKSFRRAKDFDSSIIEKREAEIYLELISNNPNS